MASQGKQAEMVKDRKGRVLSPGTPLEEAQVPEFLNLLCDILELCRVAEIEGLRKRLEYHLEKGKLTFTREWLENLNELLDELANYLLDECL